MGPLRIAAIPLAALLLPLAGCAAPASTGGVDRAIAIYREGRARGGALEVAREGRARAHRRARRPAPAELSADEAVALAKEQSALLAALEASAGAAAAEAEAADRFPNPELRFSQIRLDRYLDGRPQLRTAVRLSPPRPGEVDAEIAEARAGEAELRAEARAEEIALEADVRWLFDDVLLLDAEIAAAEAVAEARRSIAARTKTRVDAAEATGLDGAMTELSAVEAQQDSAELRALRSAALGALLDRLGLEPRASVRLVGDAPVGLPEALPPEQALVEAALRRRPEIAIAAARIDAAGARAQMERGKRWPWLSFVELGYEAAPGTDGLGWTFQAGIELPIFDTNRAGVRASDAARAAAERGLAAEVERVAREVRARLREAEAAAALLTELSGLAQPAAGRAAAAAGRALEGHGIDVLEALEVDERRVQMELRVLRLARNYRAAVSELRRAVGGQLPAAPAQRSKRSSPGERAPGSDSSAVTP